jgi:hypothetical protein
VNQGYELIRRHCEKIKQNCNKSDNCSVVIKMNSIDDNATEQWSSSTYEVGGKSVIRKNTVVKKQVTKSVRFIDETEQDVIIENLIKDAYRQGNNARTAFHYLFLILSGIFSLCLFYSFSHPFKMDHQVLTFGSCCYLTCTYVYLYI